MSTPALSPRHFPSRIADLGFTVALPEDWIAHDLPDEEPDFSGPAFLFPLALVTARNAAMAFGCAARPAYDDGSLHDWMWFLLRHNGLTPRAAGPGEAGGLPAMTGEAAQDGDLGPMTVRFALLEDGGRLVQFSLTAPDEFDDRAKRIWFAALESFQLESPRGATAALRPAVESPPAAASVEEEPIIDGEDANTFAAHCLAANAESFDPDQQMNARLRNNGVGFVPNLVSQDDDARTGTFAASALMAAVTVPYGWHIIDDSRRTLIFEPAGKTQISLNLIHHEGRAADAVLDEVEAAARNDYPAPEFIRGGYQNIHFLSVRHISDGGQPLEQCHMLVPAPRGDAFLRARVTTVPGGMTRAGNLAELIVRIVQSPPAAPESAPATGWREEVQELEAQDRMEEAEQLIRREVDHIGCAASIAEMHRRRMIRLLSAGDRAAAEQAYHAAANWMGTYAASATSGGEGAALSRERDAFCRQLAAEFGSDPAA